MSRKRQQQAMGPEDGMEAARQFAPLDPSKNKDYGPPYKNEYNWDPENKGSGNCYYQTGDEKDRCYVTTNGGPGGQKKPKTGPSGDRKTYNKKYRKQRLKKLKKKGEAMFRDDLIKLAHANPGQVRNALLPILAKEAKGKIPPQFLENIKKKKDDKGDDKDDDKGSKDEKKDDKKDDDKDSGKPWEKDKKGSTSPSFDDMVKLAHDNPGEIRTYVLSLLAKEAKGKIPPQFLENIKKKKDDKGDDKGDKDDDKKDDKGSKDDKKDDDKDSGKPWEKGATAFDDLVKLAHDNPGPIRDKLLPILAKEAKGKIPPQFLENIKKKDDDKDDDKGSKED